MDIIPQWYKRRGAKVHAKCFGYPDERLKSDICHIGEYMAVNHSRLDSEVKTEDSGSVCTDPLSNN